MAVTFDMKNDVRLDRVDLIKTVVSHGWEVHLIIQDDGSKCGNRIKEARIYNYLIRARTKDDGDLMVAYQPEMKQMTIIGKDKESENKRKLEIANILGKNKKGVYYNNKILFMDGIFWHKRFLTDEEMKDIALEVNKPDENLPYFA